MKKVTTALSILWFALVSLSSPLWTGCIWMNLTGHGKGYGYDMGGEAGVAVFLGAALLLLWLLALLPVTAFLCKKCHAGKKCPAWLPPLAFVLLFGAGIGILGWSEFISLFG